MQEFTKDESLEDEEIEERLKQLSQEAFDDPCIMLRELAQLSGKKASQAPMEDADLKSVLFEKLNEMRMSYSYKPLLIKAMLEYADEKNGTCPMEDIIFYFRDFYTKRRLKGLFVEKEKSIFSREGFSDREARRIILIYPYKRFANFRLLYYKKEEELLGFHPYLWESLSQKEKEEMKAVCDSALDRYYMRFHSKVQEDK